MTGKVVAVANMKGGVGKTTIVVGLAETLASVPILGRRLKVLVVDLDAQANSSICIAGDDVLEELLEAGASIEVYLDRAVVHGERVSLKSFIRRQATSLCAGHAPIALSLIPSSPELRYVERDMICTLTKSGYSIEAVEGRVRELFVKEVDALRREFDFILFDCPPGISSFTEAVLKASDIIITPVVPDTLSTYGLVGFCNRVLASPRLAGGAIRKPYVLANRVTPTALANRRMQEMRLEAAQPDAGFHMFRTEVPQSAALVSAVGYKDSAPTYARKYGNAQYVLEQLAAETLEILNAN